MGLCWPTQSTTVMQLNTGYQQRIAYLGSVRESDDDPIPEIKSKRNKIQVRAVVGVWEGERSREGGKGREVREGGKGREEREGEAQTMHSAP